MGKVGSDLTAVGNAASSGDIALMGALGLKLAHAVIAGEHQRPPRCASRLRSAWRRMLLWFGLAGTATYAGANQPAYASHDYALAIQNIKRGHRQMRVVKAQIQELSGT
jgi:hypothetical protein